MPKLKAPKLTFDQAIVMLPQVFQPVERASYHRLDLFLYGIEVTEQFYILWPHIGYAIADSKQYSGDHRPKNCLVIIPKGLEKECEKDDEANNEEHLSRNHHQLYVCRLGK